MNIQKNVLIVDTDTRQREVICQTLDGEGLNLIVTENMYQLFIELNI